MDANGNNVVNYVYDAWGKKLSVSGSMAGSLGYWQPFRYRGYVYDEETGLYYLRSRYYNGQMDRFVNSDEKVSLNTFSYSANCPVINADESGLDTRFNCPKCLAQGDGEAEHYHANNITSYREEDFDLRVQIIKADVEAREISTTYKPHHVSIGNRFRARITLQSNGVPSIEVLFTKNRQYGVTVRVPLENMQIKTEKVGFIDSYDRSSSKGRVNLRNTPEMNNANRMKSLEPDTIAYEVSTYKNWIMVSGGFGTGWVRKDHYTPFDDQTFALYLRRHTWR